MARLRRTVLPAVLAVAWIVYSGCSGDGAAKTPGPESEDVAAPTESDEGLSYADELAKRHRLWEENQVGQWRLKDPAVQWGYDGQGAPERWASLSEEYATCADGRQQSPIDIAGYDGGDAPPISFAYGGYAKTVRNDGKFAVVEFGPGSTLSVGQRTYTLKSAHFHSPSEHLVDGAGFAAELHLVHADADGNLAVVGLLFRLGAPSPVAQEVLDTAPAVGETTVEGFTLDAAGYAPSEPDYYRYDGSKTTPPCDEPVNWYVMRQPETISQEQVDRLLSLSGGPNNRPVQPIGDRVITTTLQPIGNRVMTTTCGCARC